MKIKIGHLTIEVLWGNQPIWEKDAKRLARKVDFEADAEWDVHRGLLKIWRIKIFRQIADDNGWDLGLKDCKEWVERHFYLNGTGLPL